MWCTLYQDLPGRCVLIVMIERIVFRFTQGTQVFVQEGQTLLCGIALNMNNVRCILVRNLPQAPIGCCMHMFVKVFKLLRSCIELVPQGRWSYAYNFFKHLWIV